MTRDLRITSRPVLREVFTQGGSKVSSTSYTHVSVDQFRSDPVSTPRLPGGGYIEPTVYSARYYVGTSYPYDYRYWNNASKYRCKGESTDVNFTVHDMEVYGCNPSSKLPTVDGSIISACEQRCYEAVRNQNWNLGQSIGEIPETVAFVKQAILALIAFYKFFRSGRYVDAVGQLDSVIFNRYNLQTAKIRGRKVAAWYAKHDSEYRSRKLKSYAKSAAKNSANAWLINKFAIQPLLSDIYSVCKLASEGMNSPGGFRAFAEMEDPLPPPPVKAGVYDWGGGWSSKRGVKVEFAFKVDNPGLFDLDRYGVLDPLAIAWELVPLSFVVDWFVPIGNFLDSLQRPFGLRFDWGYRTLYLEFGLVQKFNMHSTFIDGNLPVYGGKLDAMSRQIYISFPNPVPYFRGFGNFGFGKSVTTLALAVRRM